MSGSSLKQLVHGCQVRYIGGFRRGDLNASTSLMSVAWIAGEPLAIGANGLKKATINGTTGASDVYCIAEKSKSAYLGLASEKVMGVDVASARPLETIHGQNVLQFFVAPNYDGSGTEGYAFVKAPATPWAVGQLVYLDASGKWTNTPIASETPYGKVTEVFGNPSDAEGIEVEFNGTNK